jgi:hypothetical protein
MRIIKFSINEISYESFLANCKEEDITAKRKINVLISKDYSSVTNINDYFPDNNEVTLRTITLKVNEELHKGVMKGSDRLGIKSKRYIPYLIYKYLSE